MDLIEIYTTVATREEAQQIASALVNRKLAACAQITAIESYYSWEGSLQQSVEYRISIKSIAANYSTVEKAIVELHSYTLPAIYALPVLHAYAPYTDWVLENTTAQI